MHGLQEKWQETSSSHNRTATSLHQCLTRVLKCPWASLHRSFSISRYKDKACFLIVIFALIPGVCFTASPLRRQYMSSSSKCYLSNGFIFRRSLKSAIKGWCSCEHFYKCLCLTWSSLGMMLIRFSSLKERWLISSPVKILEVMFHVFSISSFRPHSVQYLFFLIQETSNRPDSSRELDIIH